MKLRVASKLHMRWETLIRLKPFIRLRLCVPVFALFAACGPACAADAGNGLGPALVGKLSRHEYAAALPALRKLAARRNQAAAFVLGNYHECGKVVPFSCSKAEALFRIAMSPANGAPSDPDISRRAKNELAWIHAACTQQGFARNVRLALEYTGDADLDSDPYGLDSRAAALARTGRFAEARELQHKALELLEVTTDLYQAKEYTLRAFQARLASYERSEPASFDARTAAQNCNALP